MKWSASNRPYFLSVGLIHCRVVTSIGSMHSLHPYLCLPCGQILDPPQSLHWVFILPCGQICDPPQSLHWYFNLPCWQICDPPQTLHRSFRLPCGHILDPPQSLQYCLQFSCGQMPAPPQSLHPYLCFPCGQICGFGFTSVVCLLLFLTTSTDFEWFSKHVNFLCLLKLDRCLYVFSHDLHLNRCCLIGPAIIFVEWIVTLETNCIWISMMSISLVDVSLSVFSQQMSVVVGRLFIKTSHDLNQPIRSFDFECVQTWICTLFPKIPSLAQNHQFNGFGSRQVGGLG